MKKIIFLLISIFFGVSVIAQKTEQIRAALKTKNGPELIDYLRKSKIKYFIDTVPVFSFPQFVGLPDSLAYTAKEGTVHGPFKDDKVLIKILIKAPNTFYNVHQILLDTALYPQKFADSLADKLISDIKLKKRSFKEVSLVYNSDPYVANRGGDIGWYIKGALLPEVDNKIGKVKNGVPFKVWNKNGCNIVQIARSKSDIGYALMLRVVL